MVKRKKIRIILLCAFGVLISACVGVPKTEKPQYTLHNYTFSILLDPGKPKDSPQFDLALSLLYMEYPAKEAQFFNEFMYPKASPDAYRDYIIEEQRKSYRDSLYGVTRPVSTWRYAETVEIKEEWPKGIIVERVNEIYTGGAHPYKIKRYFVLDMEEQRQVKIDDLFANFQGDRRLRAIIYDGLRYYSKLERRQALSDGIFYTNEPELTFNFTVTKEGLVLHWDPYQIAPYSAGAVEIVLPWYAIRPLMLDSGIQLLSKFDIYLFI